MGFPALGLELRKTAATRGTIQLIGCVGAWDTHKLASLIDGITQMRLNGFLIRSAGLGRWVSLLEFKLKTSMNTWLLKASETV